MTDYQVDALLASTRAFILDLQDRGWERAHERYAEAVVNTLAMSTGEAGYEYNPVVVRIEQARTLLDTLYAFSTTMSTKGFDTAIGVLKAGMDQIDSLRYESMRK